MGARNLNVSTLVLSPVDQQMYRAKSGNEILELKPGVAFDWEWEGKGESRIMKLKLSDKRVERKVDGELLGAAQEITLLDVKEQIRQSLGEIFGDKVIF